MPPLNSITRLHPHGQSLLRAAPPIIPPRPHGGAPPLACARESGEPRTSGRDAAPRAGRVHEGSVLDLVFDVLILVEGERAAEADVHDHAHRPHVQRAVVALVEQHLGRQVGRRAHHRAPERLLADDAREAEVAQLHLRRRGIEGLRACGGRASRLCASVPPLQNPRQNRTLVRIQAPLLTG